MLFLQSPVLVGTLIRHGLSQCLDKMETWTRFSNAAVDVPMPNDDDDVFSDEGASVTTYLMLGKRDFYSDYLSKGLLLACLMENTQQEADKIATTIPSLAGLRGNVASAYNSYPQSLTWAGWYSSAPDQDSVNSALGGTADARNQFGGAATNVNTFSPAADTWLSSTFKDQNGNKNANRSSLIVGACGSMRH
jgi:hypothetical protein